MHPEGKRLNELTEKIIGVAIDIHKALGPGLLESAYEACLYHDLVAKGLKVERQKPLPLIYDGVRVDCAYRMDLLVADSVVVEIKSVKELNRVHEAQIISYLKLSGMHVGLVINFNVKFLRDQGIMRRVNEFPE